MKFSQLAAQRYSVRRFDSRPVEQAVLDQILETGRLAPTAKNLQPQRIYVVRSEVLLAKLRAITAMTFDAPQVLIICADQSEAWVNPFNGRSSAEMDASIVAAHMMLQMQELGIGSTWVCWFDTEKVKQTLALRKALSRIACFPLAIPAPTAGHPANMSSASRWIRQCGISDGLCPLAFIFAAFILLEDIQSISLDVFLSLG